MTVGTCQAVAQVFGSRHAGGCANMADSRRDQGEWMRVDTLPAFGKLPAVEDYDRALAGLESETLRCTRAAPESTSPDTVNILHVSSCPGSVDAEIVRVVDFMKDQGFKVKRKSGPDMWANTDVLILGLDGSGMSHAYEVLGILTRGAGLVRGWNVLLYGLDGDPELKPDHLGPPLLTGRNFGFDAVCMLHAHMRLRNDLQFWVGYLASMTDIIEYGITHLIKASPKPLNDRDNLSCKIDILASVLREVGVRNQDVELFWHAAHLIRVVRNEYVHFMADVDQPEQQANDIADRMKVIHRLAERYERGDLLIGSRGPDADNVGVLGGETPFFVRLALLTDRWMHDCLRHCKSLPPELR